MLFSVSCKRNKFGGNKYLILLKMLKSCQTENDST